MSLKSLLAAALRSVALAATVLTLAPAPALRAGETYALEDVPDVSLQDQTGQTGRFVRDFIGSDLAVLTFTFTSCTTVCPILDGIFGRLQEELGDALGQGTVLLTVSIDPERDVPERLRAHAERLGAKPGWSFLTGEKQVVSTLLKSIEAYVPDIQSHSPTVLVVDGEGGEWTRLYGMPTPERILQVLDRMRAARLQAAEH